MNCKSGKAFNISSPEEIVFLSFLSFLPLTDSIKLYLLLMCKPWPPERLVRILAISEVVKNPSNRRKM